MQAYTTTTILFYPFRHLLVKSTWSSLAKELEKAISTIRDRYRWYKDNIMEVPYVGRT